MQSAVPSVRFHAPAPHLRRYITAYYYVDVPLGQAVEDLLHPEWANIRFALSGRWSMRLGGRTYDPAPGAALFGPSSITGVVRGEAGVVLGVGLLPLGWARFLRASAADYADGVVELSACLGDLAHSLHDSLSRAADDATQVAILDEAFSGLAASEGDVDATLLRAHDLLIDPETSSVEELAARLGVSSRHLSRLSQRMFGFAPKLLLQRQRFLRTLEALRAHPSEGWAGLIDHRYYDQSHFVRDFHRFMGMSPSAYFMLPHPLLGPAARARMSALGATLQGLHAAQV